MYRFEVGTEIAATPARVWLALCRPDQVVRWDSGVSAALDAPGDYPRPGQRVRWRYRSLLFPILIDQPQAVVAETSLRSLLSLGPYRLDETYLLTPTPEGCHLSLTLELRSRLPLLARLGGPGTRRGCVESLAQLKRYCEASRDPSMGQ